MNIGKIATFMHKIRFSDKKTGENTNIREVPVAVGAANSFRIYDVTRGKHQAINYLGCPDSSYTYGSFFVVHSSFVISSDVSPNIVRAFECDRCSNSSDIYFSHDVDDPTEVMFSQHLKGKRYTIGNLSLDKDTYEKIKSPLLDQIWTELEHKGTLKWDIRKI